MYANMCPFILCIYETLSMEGEKLTPAVGAECCFNQETWRRFGGEKDRENQTLNLEDKNLNNISYWGRGAT